MLEDAEIWQALLRAKGLTVAQLAEDLRTTRQHAHRLLTGRRSADARREELDRALALGPRRVDGRPLYAVATLGRGGDLELVPAGDTLPLYDDRDVATIVAEWLRELDDGVCVVPVWPVYAWRRTVAFHAAWGSAAEPRNVFLVDDPNLDVQVQSLLDELYGGYAETVRLRALAEDPARLNELASLLHQAVNDPWEDAAIEPGERVESLTDTVDERASERNNGQGVVVDSPGEFPDPGAAPASDPGDDTDAEKSAAEDTSVERFDEPAVRPLEHETTTGARQLITEYLLHEEREEDEPRPIDPAPGDADAERLH